MTLTSAQVKGRINHIAKQNNADPRTLMRFYAMQRFLDRIAHSKYRNNFIIKGGILLKSTFPLEISSRRRLLRMNIICCLKIVLFPYGAIIWKRSLGKSSRQFLQGVN